MTTAMAVILACTGFALLYETPLWGTSLDLFALFALGCFGATVAYSSDARWRVLRERLRQRGPALGVVVVALTVCMALGHAPTRWFTEGSLTMAVGCAAAVLLVHAALAPSSLTSRFLSSTPLQSIGLYSYSLYLLHQPLLNVILRLMRNFHLNENLLFLLLLILGVPICLALVYLFYLVCERPFTSGAKTSPLLTAMGDGRQGIYLMKTAWVRDLLQGLIYALLIIASILFFTGAASRFIYVDF
jgi:peptidoglycan/LPS O-acetylase OafA/YrhL